MASISNTACDLAVLSSHDNQSIYIVGTGIDKPVRGGNKLFGIVNERIGDFRCSELPENKLCSNPNPDSVH
jgi:hypothetical protein